MCFYAGVFGELVFERLVVAHRVAAGFEGGAIDDVGDDFGAFDVAQEFEAEALALGCARNQARHNLSGHARCSAPSARLLRGIPPSATS